MNLSSIFDPALVIPVLGLSGISLALIFGISPSLFTSQLVFYGMGVVLYLFFANVDYRIWRHFIWLFFTVSVILLVISLFGPLVRGSSRWIDLGGFRLQPSEIIKPFMIVVFASIVCNEGKKATSSLLASLLVFIPVVFLIFKQPDLGNAIVYIFTYTALLFISGIPFSYFVSGLGFFGIAIPFIWAFLKNYQRSRIISFLNPQQDPSGAGYNALQAIIAIGSGKWLGLGLGRGTQSHLRFLPEYHTDFVFASIGEELGVLGGSLIILFYFVLLGEILRIAFQTRDQFGRMICIGAFSLLFLQVFINIGMNTGILPITGITLPLVSVGGSSIISTFVALGMVASVSRLNRIRNPIVIG